jgi:hypothetical protein
MVELADTNVLAIEVGLGTQQNQTDLFLHEFSFDVNTGLPGTLSYARNGNQVQLGIGNHATTGYYYGQVRIKNQASQWSEPYQFLQN